MNKLTRKVNCPTCQKIVAWTAENKHRPFCCERCKLIDFGDWATEKHVIPGNEIIDPDIDEDHQLQ